MLQLYTSNRRIIVMKVYLLVTQVMCNINIEELKFKQYFLLYDSQPTLILFQENLCRRPTTLLSQSSTFYSREATLAKDGNLGTYFSKCAHTAMNKTLAWLQVDFGQTYSISSVQIRYRNDGIVYNNYLKHTHLTSF